MNRRVVALAVSAVVPSALADGPAYSSARVLLRATDAAVDSSIPGVYGSSSFGPIDNYGGMPVRGGQSGSTPPFAPSGAWYINAVGTHKLIQDNDVLSTVTPSTRVAGLQGGAYSRGGTFATAATTRHADATTGPSVWSIFDGQSVRFMHEGDGVEGSSDVIAALSTTTTGSAIDARGSFYVSAQLTGLSGSRAGIVRNDPVTRQNSVVMGQGDSAAWVAPGVLVEGLTPLTTTSNNELVAQVNLSGAGVTSANNWAYALRDENHTEVLYRRGQQIVGLPAGTSATLSSPSFNQSAHFAAQAVLAGPGVSALNNDAIVANSRSNPTVVAREASAVPGLPSGSAFRTFERVYSGDGDSLAFVATYRPGPPGTARGLFWKTASEPILVAQEQTVLSGLGSDEVFHNFVGGQAIGGSQLAFVGGIRNIITGDMSASGIWVCDAGMSPRLVLRSGSDVTLESGEVVRVVSFNGINSLNGNSQLLVEAILADGGHSALVLTVPSPAFAGIVGVFLASRGMRRTRR